MQVRVFFHDRCFDGAASAALFSRFYRERMRADAEFVFCGLVHRSGSLFDEHLFDSAEENAIVDFKYSTSPRVTWWFDHHQSAFLTPDDSKHFRQSRDPHRFFFDPEYKSCSKLIADVAGREFGFDAGPVAELVRWADIIDGAQYADARNAVEMKDAAPRLTMIIESSQDFSLMPRLIPLLAARPLAEVLEQPFVAPLLTPLLERHEQSIEILRQRTECREGTVFFDVTDHELEGYNKFVPYYLHPQCVYSVGLSKSSFRTKVSVGSNPWAKAKNMVNLAAICERYGGGGHARVGAISFPPGQIEQARAAAREIVAELRCADS